MHDDMMTEFDVKMTHDIDIWSETPKLEDQKHFKSWNFISNSMANVELDKALSKFLHNLAYMV